jgi:cell division protease FtsH
MNVTFKTVVFWIVIAISAMLLWQVVRSGSQAHKNPDISYSEFMSRVEAGEVIRVNVTGARIQGQFRDGKSFSLFGPANAAVYMNELHDKGVEVWFRDSSTDSVPLQLLGSWAPLILLAALWFFMIRSMQAVKQLPPKGGNSSSAIEPR